MRRNESDPGRPRHDELVGIMTSREMRQVNLAKHIVDEREFERRYGDTALFNFLITVIFRAVGMLVVVPWRLLRRR